MSHKSIRFGREHLLRQGTLVEARRSLNAAEVDPSDGRHTPVRIRHVGCKKFERRY